MSKFWAIEKIETNRDLSVYLPAAQSHKMETETERTQRENDYNTKIWNERKNWTTFAQMCKTNRNCTEKYDDIKQEQVTTAA